MAECIVIGGGVIGMMTARALHLSGMDVLLLERGPLGGESSWAGGGIISPLYPWRYPDSVNVLAQHSKTLYPDLVAQLRDESQVDCELLHSGLLIVDQEERESAMEWSRRWSENMQHITGRKDLLFIEPAVASEIDQALWMAKVMQVRNPSIMKALRGSFDRLGIAYREHALVRDIIVQSGRVTGVQVGDERLEADRVIVAGGAWSAGLIEAVQHIDVEPVKGQMIMFKGEPDLVRRIVLAEGHYIIPRRDGRVLAGSTLEKTGFDKTTSERALETLTATATALVPVLATLPVERQWAGLRPGTANGVPYVCAVDDVEGLYLHAGHYRNGIVLGPASVQLMTELVLGKKPHCDPSPYKVGALH
ncbi:MAG: glycine oxidase ThiO [Gammaproteobacteria bacterium]|jgi:glycine oxidase|nr:glycine oxidase ThiO [Gammaproteobacteria bacterium]